MTARQPSALDELRKAVISGETAAFKTRARIDAGAIRRIMLGIDPDGNGRCEITPRGIAICNATIVGRVDLNAVVAEGGGPICSLEFCNCRFEGGFSGAHASFTRLCFDDCTFAETPESDDATQPSIDLSGATVAGDLDLNRISSVQKDGRMSIRATGAKVQGRISLQGAALRAPTSTTGAASDESALDALCLLLARVDGDIHLIDGATVEGRINMRNARVSGDVWLSGSTLTNPTGEAIFLRGAHIEGGLVMGGRRASEGSDSGMHSFICEGALNLRGVRIDGEIWMEEFTIDSSRVQEDPWVPGLYLSAAQIGRGLSIRSGRVIGRIDLRDAQIGRDLRLKDVTVGWNGREGVPTIDGRRMAAGQIRITRLRPEACEIGGGADAARPLQVMLDVSDAKTGKMILETCEINGPLVATDLQCRGDVSLDLGAQHGVDMLGVSVGGNLDLSRLEIGDEQPGCDHYRGLRLKNGDIARSLRIVPPATSSGALQGVVDLTDLSCDTLEDLSGRGWGRDVVVRMNHFTYHRTDWRVTEVESRRSLLEQRRADLLSRAAEHRPLNLLLGRTRRFQGLRTGRHWSAWRSRRNWIYQQFPESLALVSPTLHRIEQWEYHSQPFEQAIRVARAEGREDLALQFEILKQRIEWDHTNRRSRLGFVNLAVTATTLWLLYWLGTDGLIAAALGAVAGFILWALLERSTGTSLTGRTPSQPHGQAEPRRLPFYLQILPILGGFLVSAWALNSTPATWMTLATGAAIFLVITFASEIADWFLRHGFGYLRRPARAMQTLILSFLLGWLGVHFANDDEMLVVSVTPVASVAEPYGQRIRIGAQMMAGGRAATNIRCGTEISEPLYALDVLIPLLDLRQENRCDVGRAELPDNQRRRQNRSLLEGRPSDPLNEPENWWAFAKALYAILGWVVVSLSILTFVNINRSRSEIT